MKHREPVAVITAVTTLIEAAIALAVGFGLDLKPEQVALLMAVIVAAGNLVNTLWARAHVTPVASPTDANNRSPLPA